ncbi:MAG TPA: biopolymer transporter ExbD [Gemmatimonadaceae bacterium]|nr:biopolymer transporter ExbD [Gemmatimonadaceae bacterium]
MAFSSGGSGGLTNEPNVTPMIDVLLVLLIIFIMAVQNLRKAIDVQLPDPNPQQVQSPQQMNQIVLQVLPNGVFKINNEETPKANLASRLKEIYDPRPDKIIFIKGDPAVKYQDVIYAMDVSRGAGVKVIGMAPKQ